MTKGSIFQHVHRRLVSRLRDALAIGTLARRLCPLIWKLLHKGVIYEERGPAIRRRCKQDREANMILDSRSFSRRVELAVGEESSPLVRVLVGSAAIHDPPILTKRSRYTTPHKSRYPSWRVSLGTPASREEPFL